MNEENRPPKAENSGEKRKSDRTKRLLLLLLLLLLLITLASVSVTMWLLFFRGEETVLAPDYAPRETEANQIPLETESITDDAKLEAEDGGGAVSLRYSPYVTIDLSDRLCVISFANPGKSAEDMLVQIVVQEEVLAQSGRLTPGHQLTALTLLDGAEKKLAVGGYDGKYVVYYYDPDTGEKSIVNTEIPISISVVE